MEHRSQIAKNCCCAGNEQQKTLDDSEVPETEQRAHAKDTHGKQTKTNTSNIIILGTCESIRPYGVLGTDYCCRGFLTSKNNMRHGNSSETWNDRYDIIYSIPTATRPIKRRTRGGLKIAARVPYAMAYVGSSSAALTKGFFSPFSRRPDGCVTNLTSTAMLMPSYIAVMCQLTTPKIYRYLSTEVLQQYK